jgi:hypothetical protein
MQIYQQSMVTFDRSIFKHNWKSINETPLKHAGLLARRIERGLIRRDRSRSQRPSRPGRPPKSRHPSDIFRRIFSLPGPTDVLVGHVGLFGRRQTVMEIHEFGQVVPLKQKVIGINPYRIQDPAQRAKVRQLYLSGKLKNKKVPIVTRMVKYPERPFARPTTQRVTPMLPNLWKNSVTSKTTRSRPTMGSSIRVTSAVYNK